MLGTLAPEFWPMVGRLAAVVGGGALLALLTHNLTGRSTGRNTATAVRASLWPRFWVWCAIAAGITLIVGFDGGIFALGMAVGGIFAFRELFPALRRGPTPVASGTAAAFCLALIWVGLPLTLLVLLRNRPDGFGVVAWVFMVVAFSDILAMVGGLLAGRTPFMASVSPGKTVEGLVAGLAGGLLAAWLVGFALPNARLAPYLFASLALSVAGVVGDLAASAVKRRAGLKDFGAALPGHGGVMDRLDSLLGAAPVAYLIVRFGGLS